MFAATIGIFSFELISNYLLTKLQRYNLSGATIVWLTITLFVIITIHRFLGKKFIIFTLIVLLGYLLALTSDIEGIRRFGIYLKHIAYILICYYYFKVSDAQTRFLLFSILLFFSGWLFANTLLYLIENGRNYSDLSFNFCFMRSKCMIQ